MAAGIGKPKSKPVTISRLRSGNLQTADHKQLNQPNIFFYYMALWNVSACFYTYKLCCKLHAKLVVYLISSKYVKYVNTIHFEPNDTVYNIATKASL